jgi:hypothetical protein
MLERTYAHLLESSAEAARQRLDVFAATERKGGRTFGPLVGHRSGAGRIP